MANRKTSIKSAIACAVIALAVMFCTFPSLTATARAEDRPMEAVNVSRLSDIQDGYDAGLTGIGYEIVVPIS